MGSVVVRIPSETHSRLRELADARHETIGFVISELVEDIEDRQFWERARASIMQTTQDPVAWKELRDEQRVYDHALLDGLDGE
jgi:predicted DNA-binding protein